MPSKMLTAIALLSSLVAQVAAIPTISTLGNKFFDSTGKQFYIKGKLEPDCRATANQADKI